MADITLANPTVNSGTTVSLKGATVNYAWKNLTRNTPVPGKNAIIESQYNGFENPKITITGYIDVDNTSANEITQELLQNFASVQYDGTSGTVTTLVIPTGDTPTYLKDSTGLVDSLKVVIESFSIRLGMDSSNAHFWAYNLLLVETG
tara:strand:+ start:1635 stop:2078 length:444 start_codon:yes stop_codon:yes gene_type:complete